MPNDLTIAEFEQARNDIYKTLAEWILAHHQTVLERKYSVKDPIWTALQQSIKPFDLLTCMKTISKLKDEINAVFQDLHLPVLFTTTLQRTAMGDLYFTAHIVPASFDTVAIGYTDGPFTTIIPSNNTRQHYAIIGPYIKQFNMPTSPFFTPSETRAHTVLNAGGSLTADIDNMKKAAAQIAPSITNLEKDLARACALLLSEVIDPKTFKQKYVD